MLYKTILLIANAIKLYCQMFFPFFPNFCKPFRLKVFSLYLHNTCVNQEHLITFVLNSTQFHEISFAKISKGKHFKV